MTTNERIHWAVSLLDIQPTDSILEIGCGAGLAVHQVARKLTSGKITAIDQSQAMITMASRRNNAFIDTEKAVLLTGKLAGIQLPDQVYDKIFAFNVSVFWKNPIRELQIITSHLRPNGAFYLFHQPPYDITKQIAEKASEQLKKGNFTIMQTIFKALPPAAAFCIIAQPIK